MRVRARTKFIIATVTMLFLVGTSLISIPLLTGTPFFMSIPTSNKSPGESLPISGITTLNETHLIVHYNYSRKERIAYYKEGAWTIDWVDITWWDVINGTQPPPIDLRLQTETRQYIERVMENQEQIPSLACAFRDPHRGIIYIMLANMSETAKVLEIMNPPSHIPVKFIEVNYSENQLKEWYQLLTQLLFNSSSLLYSRETIEQELGLKVVMMGFPIYNASITIGLDIWTVEEGAKLTRYQKDEKLLHYVQNFAENILKKYDIPLDAVWFVETGIPKLYAKTDKFPTLVGGIKIECMSAFSTLGFTAYHYDRGERGFVISGHSTKVDKSVYQPNWPNKVGTTKKDPGPPRVSDAAWVKLEARQITNKIYGGFTVLGKKPSSKQNDGDIASFQGFQSCGGSGQILYKDVRLYNDEYGWMDHQIIADFENNDPVKSDSGAPVISFDYTSIDYVNIAGILWGGSDDPELEWEYYSPIDCVEADLGQLDVTYSDV